MKRGKSRLGQEWRVIARACTIHSMFSLGVQLLNTLFLITGLLGLGLLQVSQLLRGRWNMQKSICNSLVNKKLTSLISMFSQS